MLFTNNKKYSKEKGKKTSKEQFQTKNNNTNSRSIKTKSNQNIDTNKELVKSIAKPLKNSKQYEMMALNLSKVLREEKIFVDIVGKYRKALIYKDYQVPIVKSTGQKIITPIRFKLGEWEELEFILKRDPNDFSNLKNKFYDWFNNFNNIDVQNIVQEFYNNNVVGFINANCKHTPELEDTILESLKRTSKQTRGYEEKLKVAIGKLQEEFSEIERIKKIETRLAIDKYEESFPLARALRRKIIINIGPTNSGKTHSALEILSKAETGIYLAPLRLMAAEGQDSLNKRGVSCNLLTGEERITQEDAKHTSSTIEMCEFNKRVEVAVIDEIQMIADPSRGWAWSQALIGVSANTVILVGSEECLPYILPILDNLGEEYEINPHKRKTPLKHRDPLWKLSDLRTGDALVVFSRKQALEKKYEIESYGKKCSVIYGNLSPEVRRSEADKFRNGENDILVATDAIGMGLNLPIQRLFLNSITKYDGIEERDLTISELKQICGRAGRFGFADSGIVGLFSDDRHSSKELLEKAIYGGYEKPSDNRIFISPNFKQVTTIADSLETKDIYSIYVFFKEKLIRQHELYKTANLDSMIEVASQIRNKIKDLKTSFTYTCVPIDINNENHSKHLNEWIQLHNIGANIICPKIPENIEYLPNNPYTLYEAEIYVKLCMAYRWLHYKFPEIYSEIKEAEENTRIVNRYIEHYLNKEIKTKHIAKKQWKQKK